MKRKKGGELTDATRAQGVGCAIQLRTARPLSSLNSRRPPTHSTWQCSTSTTYAPWRRVGRFYSLRGPRRRSSSFGARPLTVSGVPHLASALDQNNPILVRNEYELVWDYIEGQRSRRVLKMGGLVIYGQPGIGMSSKGCLEARG